jgi:nucleoside-diphosphate-sugar epimerase
MTDAAKTVLVTGATGFVGRWTLPHLSARGFDVHAVTSRFPVADGLDTHWHRADLMNGAEVETLVQAVRPAYLLHLAWFTGHRRFWTDPVNFQWVKASLDLVHAFQRAGGRRMVLAGTCAEYGPCRERCSDLSTPLVPGTLYGTCKHAVQLMTTSFARQTGVSAAWGRLFFLFGPYEPVERLVPSVISALLEGRPARCSHGNQLRDFLEVDDAAGALVALLESDVTGPVNIGSGTPTPIRTVVEAIGARLGRPDLIRLGALEAPPGEPAVLVADTSRLTTEVAWRPTHSLAAGLTRAIAWWQASQVDRPTTAHTRES